MLFTLMAYLDSSQYKDIFEFISTNRNLLSKVVIAMLYQSVFYFELYFTFSQDWNSFSSLVF